MTNPTGHTPAGNPEREALQRIADGDVPGEGDYSDCVKAFAKAALSTPQEPTGKDNLRVAIKLALACGCENCLRGLAKQAGVEVELRSIPADDTALPESPRAERSE